MKYIEFMRRIANMVLNDEYYSAKELLDKTKYICEMQYGIKLNSDLEVIQLIEIAKNYKINHI